MRRSVILAAALVLIAHAACAASSIALWGTPKYTARFTHFDYTDPAAPKGGTLKLSTNAAFDSINPYILRGLAAPGIAGYVYQPLMMQSYDEPESFYALIAQSFNLAPDRSYADVTLNPAARWSDGQPITADDIVFTVNALKEQGHPLYRAQFKPITVEKTGTRTVRFHFADRTHRELPLIVASMPVLPAHYFAKVPFDKTTLAPPVGSGPYRVSAIEAGRSITFTRDENYWGANLPSQVGMYNFDSIHYDVYRDDTVALEGIKSHQFDYYEEFIARNWATAYDIPAVKSGELIKARIPHKIPRGMQGFIFNTRLPKFTDPKVREAIALTLDFEWMNKALFYNAYERNRSFFNNTEFEAKGLPDEGEQKLLAPYRADLPASIFTTPYEVPKTDASGFPRANLIRAQQLLDAAGWVMKNGHRVNAKTGEKLTIEFLMTQRTFERVIAVMRVNLAKLGIDASFRYIDASQYQKRIEHHDFDIVSIWWNLGVLFPSTEQFLYWHSSQADTEGSQNLGGVKNPAVDALVQAIQHAQSLDELQTAARALDRVLLAEYYVIPHWTITAWRVLYWNQFAHPKITPNYNICLDCWWVLPKGETSAPPVAGGGT